MTADPADDDTIYTENLGDLVRLPAPVETERSRQRLRVDSTTAALVRRLLSLPPQSRVVIVCDVQEDGRLLWDLAHCTERAS